MDPLKIMLFITVAVFMILTPTVLLFKIIFGTHTSGQSERSFIIPLMVSGIMVAVAYVIYTRLLI